MIVVVYFEIDNEHRDAFLTHVRRQAKDSMTLETACRRFDVAVDPRDQKRVLLYEVYDTAEDFAAHLRTAHFKAFDAAVSAWVTDKRVEVWDGPEAID